MQTAMFNDGVKKVLGYYLSYPEDRVVSVSYFYKHRWVIKKSSGEFLIYSEEEWEERQTRTNSMEKEFAGRIE